MAEGIIALIIALAIVAVVYIILKWIIGYFPIPTPLAQVINIIFGVIVIVMVLRFLLTLL